MMKSNTIKQPFSPYFRSIQNEDDGNFYTKICFYSINSNLKFQHQVGTWILERSQQLWFPC